MAKIENVNFALIKKWEGGLSDDTADPAAAFPLPDGSGIHTNVGITWKTFSANALRLGYAATPENFKKMPAETWLKIYKDGFWDGIQADRIESQAIGEFLADWAWGSGPLTAGKNLQRYLSTTGSDLKVDGKVGPVTIGLLNDLTLKRGERIVFEDLDLFKRNFLKGVKTYQIHGFGWFNRMDDFRNYAVTIIKM